MASKQQQLREMMKKAQQQGAGGENLSAIEKARMLKALRKKQKEEQGMCVLYLLCYLLLTMFVRCLSCLLD